MSGLTTEGFESTIANGMVLVDFWAEWCGYCRMLAPVIEELQSRHSGKIKVVKVNVDDESELAARYSITTLPTIATFKNGKEIDRKIGLQSIEALEKMIADLRGEG
ncbi:MAG: thioredoxin [Oscillospiraceae bacterium]|nr:thioredoxin [Oscillospiraceae bacterium]